MEAIALETSTRDGRGKGPARRLRMAGRVPAVVYGHNVESAIAVSLDPKELDKALANPKEANALFQVSIDGDASHTVMAREIQRHPVSRAILHLDFVAPDLDKTMVSSVPFEVTGRSKGVVIGGRLRTPYREVKLRAKPADIPAKITLDITELDIGDTVYASNLELPEGVEAVFDRDYVVAKVLKPRGVAKKKEEETKKKK